MYRIPDWVIQTAWWISGIFATGAFWYFLSIKNDQYTALAALLACLFAGAAIFLHRKNDQTEKDTSPKPDFVVSVGEETVTFTELVRSLEYDIVKVNAHTHIVGVLAEHRWIAHMYPDCELETQALMTFDGVRGGDNALIHFDVLTITKSTGRTKEVYFDISSFFSGRGNLMDRDSAVARKLAQLYALPETSGSFPSRDTAP